jgi:hypothetical protein
MLAPTSVKSRPATECRLSKQRLKNLNAIFVQHHIKNLYCIFTHTLKLLKNNKKYEFYNFSKKLI